MNMTLLNLRLHVSAARAIPVRRCKRPNYSKPRGSPRHRQGSLYLRLPDGGRLSGSIRLLRGSPEPRIQSALEPYLQRG